jgi:hypothetical protein
MKNHDLSEFALDEADRMRRLASEYKQLGLTNLSRHLRLNADRAMRWAGRYANAAPQQDTSDDGRCAERVA